MLWRSFEVVQRIIQFTYFTFLFLTRKPRDISIQTSSFRSPCRCLLQIELVQTTIQGWLQKRVRSRWNSSLQTVQSFLIIHPVNLTEAFCHQSCCKSLDCSISLIFDSEDPLASYCLFSSWKWSKLPCMTLNQSFHIFT